MSRPPSRQSSGATSELVYESYELGSGYLATIFHPENDDAWIQSDETRPIRE